MAPRVTEFGVRSGVSTIGWMMGGSTKIVGYDLHVVPSLNELTEMCYGCGCVAEFIEGDTAQITIDETDLLFIDSLHTGEHLRVELFRHHEQVRKFIVLHDTSSCGQGADIMGLWAYETYCRVNANDVHTEGLLSAIDEFLRETGGTWARMGEKKNNNGLMILRRRVDRP
jgi:hypothetical protein|eukprot:Stramenopile-MAST_4_protein_818